MKKPGPPKQFDSRLNVHLPEALKKHAEAMAAKRGKGVSEFVRDLIEHAARQDPVT